MTKYKAGDKVTIVLDESDAATFNYCGDEYKIISHEPAPEPIIEFYNVYEMGGVVFGHKDLQLARQLMTSGCLGQIKITTTGNDFTVEKEKL